MPARKKTGKALIVLGVLALVAGLVLFGLTKPLWALGLMAAGTALIVSGSGSWARNNGGSAVHHHERKHS